MPDGSIAAIGDKMPDGTTYAGTPPSGQRYTAETPDPAEAAA
jgi:hypothetical protein